MRNSIVRRGGNKSENLVEVVFPYFPTRELDPPRFVRWQTHPTKVRRGFEFNERVLIEGDRIIASAPKSWTKFNSRCEICQKSRISRLILSNCPRLFIRTASRDALRQGICVRGPPVWYCVWNCPLTHMIPFIWKEHVSFFYEPSTKWKWTYLKAHQRTSMIPLRKCGVECTRSSRKKEGEEEKSPPEWEGTPTRE